MPEILPNDDETIFLASLRVGEARNNRSWLASVQKDCGRWGRRSCPGDAKCRSRCSHKIKKSKAGTETTARHRVSAELLGENQDATVCAASLSTPAARGSLTRKVVPEEEVFSTSTEPPWSWITLLTMARPSPVPLDFPRLTNGSNKVLEIAGGTPEPRSITRTSKRSDHERMSISISPRVCAEASQAFKTRLKKTRSIFCGSKVPVISPAARMEMERCRISA